MVLYLCIPTDDFNKILGSLISESTNKIHPLVSGLMLLTALDCEGE